MSRDHRCEMVKIKESQRESIMNFVNTANTTHSNRRAISHGGRRLGYTTVLALLAGHAFSQDAPARGGHAANDVGGGITEIVVTAQKRSQSIQDVGISVSVVTPEILEAQGITNVPDLGHMLSNTEINYNFGAAFFAVRGIGSEQFAVNLDAPIAVNVDEVYLSKSFMTGLLLFDVDRVEALKGPQGTLFGRNTTGGAINIYTRRPTEELSAGATMSYDNYDTIRSEGYLSGAIVPGLTGRLSGMVAHQDEGYYKNVTRNETEGRDRRRAVRLQLQWKGDNTSALLSSYYGRDRSDSAPSHTWGIYTPESLAAGSPVLCPEYLNGTVNGATANCLRGIDGDYPRTKNPYISSGGTPNDIRSTGFGHTVRIEHDLSASTITSISSYQHYLRDEQHDAEGGPINTIEIFDYNKINQFTQELRLSSAGDTSWNYTIGGFFERDKYWNKDTLSIAGGEQMLYTDYDQTLNAMALFAHNEVALTDTVDLIAGVRYSRERIKIDGGTYFGTGLVGNRIQRPGTILATLSHSSLVKNGGKRTDEDVSYKAGFQWTPIEDGETFDKLMMYGHVATGFRSGAFNAEFVDTQSAFTSLSPEELTAYEVGFKSSLASRTVQLNGALFWYDFQDGFINVDRPNSVVATTVNAAKIKSMGGELEVRWQPIWNLNLSAEGSYLDAEFRSDIRVGGVSLKGNQPVNSPKWTGSFGANYEIPLPNGMKIDLSGAASYRSSRYLASANKPSNHQPSYWLINTFIALADSHDRWRISGWVRNLTQERYQTFVNDVPGYGVLNIYGAPRTYGLTLSVQTQ